VPHPLEHSAADRPLGSREAESLAETMRAFGTASRVRLLYELLRGVRSVEELASAVGMEANTVSQQLRVLRHLRLVSPARDGRHVRYRLHDDHIAALLTAIRHHHEHTQPGFAHELAAEARVADEERS
jgi:DNA-binding transcriptional ArsR family regulator